jgi:hypothetical protein
MSLSESPPTPIDVIFENILGFLLPFFLASAGGDADLGRAAIQELAEAYRVATATELELVGRLLGFSVVAMDNLRLSMDREMSLSMVLRYRSNAVALSRAGEQCRKVLEVVQGNRKPVQQSLPSQVPGVPKPNIAAAPPAPVRAKASLHPTVGTAWDRPVAVSLNGAALPADFMSEFPLDIESMKRDARILLAAFSKDAGALPAAAAVFPKVPDPGGVVDAAMRQAFKVSGGRTPRNAM